MRKLGALAMTLQIFAINPFVNIPLNSMKENNVQMILDTTIPSSTNKILEKWTPPPKKPHQKKQKQNIQLQLQDKFWSWFQIIFYQKTKRSISFLLLLNQAS